MSRSILCKRVIPQYLKTCGRYNISQRCLGSFVKQHKLYESLFKVITPSLFNCQWRTIFISKSCRHSSNKPTPDIENDEDIQNILKDFANDFNLNIESEGPILEEIKQSLNQPEEGIPSTEKDASSSNDNTESAAPEEKFKKFSESDSVVIPSQEDLECEKYTKEEITFHVDQKWNRDASQVLCKRKIAFALLTNRQLSHLYYGLGF